MLVQTPRAHQLLPIEPAIKEEELHLGDSALEDTPEEQDLSADYEFEPDADTLLEALLPQYVSRILFSMFLELRLPSPQLVELQ